MSEESQDPEVSALLDRWRAGDRAALEALIGLVEPELRRMAHGRAIGLRVQLRPVGIEPSLDTVGLISELYLRLLSRDVSWQNRAHFFAAAALRLRAICVDYARRTLAVKRDRRLVAAGESKPGSEAQPIDILALEQALGRLEAIAPRQVHILTLRFYGGLTDRELAEVTELSEATVRRDWRAARAWLYRELTDGPPAETA